MPQNKPKPDDRTDNVEKIREHIASTKENIELASEMIAETSDHKARKELEAKNVRREKAIESMENELRDEEFAMENGYQ